MNNRWLRTLALMLLIAAFTACGSTRVRPSRSAWATPQTGSNIGRRLATTQPPESRSARAKVAKAKKPKKRATPEPAAQREDEDYVTRGGFR